MKISIDYIFKATPLIVRRIRNATVNTIAGSLPFAKIIADRFEISVEDYAMYAGLAILLTKGFASLFGVPENTASGTLEVTDNAEAKKPMVSDDSNG